MWRFNNLSIIKNNFIYFFLEVGVILPPGLSHMIKVMMDGTHHNSQLQTHL
jgi:hypothetical protein